MSYTLYIIIKSDSFFFCTVVYVLIDAINIVYFCTAAPWFILLLLYISLHFCIKFMSLQLLHVWPVQSLSRYEQKNLTRNKNKTAYDNFYTPTLHSLLPNTHTHTTRPHPPPPSEGGREGGRLGQFDGLPHSSVAIVGSTAADHQVNVRHCHGADKVIVSSEDLWHLRGRSGGGGMRVNSTKLISSERASQEEQNGTLQIRSNI